MDLQRELIESSKTPRSRMKRVRAYATSIALHAVLVGGILYAGSNKLSHKIDSQSPIEAFISQGAAPPPPPPPPPPPKRSGVAQPTTPRVQPKPVEVAKVNPLTPPVEIPKEIPIIPLPVPQTSLPVVENTSLEPAGGMDTGPGDAANGVAGGVEGGVAGGVVGGEVGGEIGGELGGVKGGEIGGVVGGEVGGTGTGTAGEGAGGDDAPPVVEAPPSGPLRVGGNVKAPVAIERVKPDYTDTARKAKITGTVIVEAIIDTNGNVRDVRVIKGLPMGLGAQAEEAVKKWKFKPGTLNGEPVSVIFNLTVTFTLG
jgi:periplasmic protein TonB